MKKYDMTFEEAQDYCSKRGIDTPWNDGDRLMIDGRYITQTVGNVLKWSDDTHTIKDCDVEEYLMGMKKRDLAYLITQLMLKDKLDITDINTYYTQALQEKIAKKDAIIQEADNCIFNSLFYDHLGKTDSANVILDKVKWRYKYADTNKEELCKMFNYDPEKDKEAEK